MTVRRYHYERAFEAYLRDRRIPYVSVDDARKSLLPRGTGGMGGEDGASLKSFDFVIYGEQENLLVEVKGRKIPKATGGGARRRLECWVTRQDLDALRTWERLFGGGFEAAFCFCYWCEDQPPDGLFQELIVHQDRWYALRSIRLRDYIAAIRVRSPRWQTFDLSPRDFEALSQPLTVRDSAPEAASEAGPEPAGFEPLDCSPAGTLYDGFANRSLSTRT